jgi:hypothetical protein
MENGFFAGELNDYFFLLMEFHFPILLTKDLHHV